MQQGEPITDGAPLIFTERSEGVRPEFDIRTDTWDLAYEAMDQVTKNHLTKREERMKAKDANNDKKNTPPPGPGGGSE